MLLISVDRLRQQWDESNSSILNRHAELDEMLLECKQLDDVTDEFTRWADKVETSMGGKCVPGQTVEELKRQIKEHKVSTLS